MIRGGWIAVAASAAALMAPAAAQLTPAPRDVIGFSFEDLEETATDTGWTTTRYTDPDGIEVLIVEIDVEVAAPVAVPSPVEPAVTADPAAPFPGKDGDTADDHDADGRARPPAIVTRKIALWPRACYDSGRCHGLYAFAVLPAVASTVQANAFNARLPSARATVREGRVVLDRYIVGDFGVTRGSLGIDLQLLARQVDDWYAFAGGTEGQAWQAGFDPLLPLTVRVPNAAGHRESVTFPARLVEALAAGNAPRQ